VLPLIRVVVVQVNNVVDLIGVVDCGDMPTDDDIAVAVLRRGQLAGKVLRCRVRFPSEVVIKDSALI
jgi:hypothetical protein